MTLSEAVSKTYLLATGKATPPTSGSSKHSAIVAYLNMHKDTWANEPGIFWRSLRTLADLTATVTATDTFALVSGGENLQNVSTQEGDYIKITVGDTVWRYTIVPDELIGEYGTSEVVSIRGNSLIFPTAFTADSPQLGGTITVPHHPAPADLSDDADTYPIDDPLFGCYMAAADFVRTDLTRSYLEPGLVAKAANAMEAMKLANDSQVEEVYSPAFLYNAGQTWD